MFSDRWQLTFTVLLLFQMHCVLSIYRVINHFCVTLWLSQELENTKPAAYSSEDTQMNSTYVKGNKAISTHQIPDAGIVPQCLMSSVMANTACQQKKEESQKYESHSSVWLNKYSDVHQTHYTHISLLVGWEENYFSSNSEKRQHTVISMI